MKKVITILCLLLIVLPGYSQTYSGKIIKVVDGDTYFFQTATGSLKVRMFGIDAPERDQPFSKESAGFLSKYLHQEAVFKRQGTDRYGRTLGILFIENQDINLLTIKKGHAWHFKRYLSDQQYADAEVLAKENKLGF